MQADRLFDVAIAQDGNPVDAGARKAFNIELKLQRDLVVIVQTRRGLYFQSQILIFGGWIAGLRGGTYRGLQSIESNGHGIGRIVRGCKIDCAVAIQIGAR